MGGNFTVVASFAPLLLLTILILLTALSIVLLLISRMATYVLPAALFGAGAALLSDPAGFHVAYVLLAILASSALIMTLFTLLPPVRSILDGLNNLVHDIFARN